jgi:outer membrane lipoprotein carrier protein
MQIRFWKSRRASILLLFLMALVASDAFAESASITSLNRFYSQINTFQADFTQSLVDKSGQLVERATGRVSLKRPGQFRWEYDKPYAQIIVSDGVKVRHYDIELAQVTVRPVSEALASTPALLLTGQGTLTEGFDIQDGGELEGLQWVQLTPKADDTDFKTIRLGFRQGKLAMMFLADSFDQVTHIEFTRIEVNRPLSNAHFVLQLPEGVDVVGD